MSLETAVSRRCSRNSISETDSALSGTFFQDNNLADIISNGEAIAGTIYEMLTDEAKGVLDTSDVILAKGQGNYESMSGQGRHIFYEFLCKCDLFTTRFNVPKLTGMFIEER